MNPITVSLLLTFVVATATVAEAPLAWAGTRDQERMVVGVLTEQYRRECLPNYKERWVEPRFEVGFVRLVRGGTKVSEALVGKPVLVEGRLAPRPRDPPPGDRCPAHQMRSDWVIGKAGFRILRPSSRPSLLVALVPRAVQPFRGVTVTKIGDRLRATLALPGRGLYPRVDLVMHFEGCYGKPGSVSRRQEFLQVQGGKQLTATFPTWVPHDGVGPGHDRRRAGYRAYSLEVVAPGGPVTFDLDLVLGRHAGVQVTCPRR